MLTAADMAECRWLKPELVAQIEFVEWTEANHLRHARFVGLREGNNPKTCTAKFRCLRLNRPSLEGKENYDYGDNDYRGCSVAYHCCPLQSKSPPSPLPFKILNRPPIYGDNQN